MSKADAGYIWVSSPAWERGASLERQREAVLAAAARWGFSISPDDLIRERWSGSDSGRAGMRALCILVEGRLIQHVFVLDTALLARYTFHLLQFLQQCEVPGVLFHLPDGTLVPTELDEGVRFMRGPLGFQARGLLAEESQDFEH